MNKRVINKVVKSKFDEWVKTITDENVKKLVNENTILTGGSITSMLLNEPVNDYDFYFRNKKTVLAVANYYVNLFKKNNQPKHANGNPVEISVREETDRVKIVVKSAGIAGETEEESADYRYFEQDPVSSGQTTTQEYIDTVTEVFHKKDNKNRYSPILLTSNAISLSDDIQLVIRFYGDPVVIHENYDFKHCTNYWTSWDDEVVLNADALECILSRELKYIGSKYPVASLFRIRKFIKRGWTINAGQMFKIISQVHDVDLNDIHVLEDQLTGVDVAYFHEIIRKLKEKNPEAIDHTYLMTLIEEIFG